MNTFNTFLRHLRGVGGGRLDLLKSSRVCYVYIRYARKLEGGNDMFHLWRLTRLYLIYPLFDLLFSEGEKVERRFKRDFYRKIKNIPMDIWGVSLSEDGPRFITNTSGDNNHEPIQVGWTFTGNRVMSGEPVYKPSLIADPYEYLGYGGLAINGTQSIIVDWLYKDLCWYFRRELRILKRTKKEQGRAKERSAASAEESKYQDFLRGIVKEK